MWSEAMNLKLAFEEQRCLRDAVEIVPAGLKTGTIIPTGKSKIYSMLVGDIQTLRALRGNEVDLVVKVPIVTDESTVLHNLQM